MPIYLSPKCLCPVRPEMAKAQTIDEQLMADVATIAGPETMSQKLLEYQDLAGLNNFLTQTKFGALPADKTCANMDAVAREVLPYFQDHDAKEPVEAASGE